MCVCGSAGWEGGAGRAWEDVKGKGGGGEGGTSLLLGVCVAHPQHITHAALFQQRAEAGMAAASKRDGMGGSKMDGVR